MLKQKIIFTPLRVLRNKSSSVNAATKHYSTHVQAASVTTVFDDDNVIPVHGLLAGAFEASQDDDLLIEVDSDTDNDISAVNCSEPPPVRDEKSDLEAVLSR